MGEFYNYKGTESIVLMAIVDANYCFIYVNVGCQGRISDGGVFRNTEFYRKLENNDLYIPQDEALPGRTIPVPYTLVADDAFPLTIHTMKPYATDLNKGPRKEYSITEFQEQGVLWKMHLGYLRLYSEFFENQ